MARPLKQLDEISEKHKAPILCAGDVFHHWNSPPELINWAYEHLPMMFAIPGQHDLPHHDFHSIHKSAFQTMVEMGKILTSRKRLRRHGMDVHSFPFGFKVNHPGGARIECNQIALIHSYIWQEGNTYPGAPEEKHTKRYQEKLKGFDVAVFGDNHSGFSSFGDCRIFNCGTLIPRRIDEREYTPMVGLLREDGTIDVHHLDTSEDKWVEESEEIVKTGENEEEQQRMVESLKSLESSDIDFRSVLERSLGKVGEGAKQVILEELEK
jgi:hypothetical protein